MEPSADLDVTRGNQEVVELGDLRIDEPTIEEGPRAGSSAHEPRLLTCSSVYSRPFWPCSFMLWRGKLTTSEFGNIAAVVTTPVVGLLGAATGYYYGRGRR